MRKFFNPILMVVFVLSMVLVGCDQKSKDSDQETKAPKGKVKKSKKGEDSDKEKGNSTSENSNKEASFEQEYIIDDEQKAAAFKEVERMIDEEKNLYPVSIGDYVEISKIELDKKSRSIVYYISIDDNLYDVNVLNQNKELARSNSILSIAQQKDFIQNLADADLGVVIKYINPYSRNKATVVLTKDDIKDVLDFAISPQKIAQLTLQSQLELANMNCPIQVNEVTKMEGIVDNGDNIMYYYEVPDYILSAIAESSEHYDSVRNSWINPTDPSIYNMAQILKQLSKGVIYRYMNESGTEYFDIEISHYEL